MKTGIRILIVDDEENIRGLLSEVLSEEGYNVTETVSGENALEVFRKNPYPLVITDIRMDGMSGIQLLQEIKHLNPDTQVVIITSHASLESAITALRSGAYDYLVKPFGDLELISAVVNRAIDKISLITENRVLIGKLKQSNEELEHVNKVLKELAIRDGLTGLYNHRYFQDILALEVIRSRRHKRIFSLIMLDVDFFKQYNDTYGHPEGDQVLKTLSQILKGHLRKTDTVARYGGEEFVFILPETSKNNARDLSETIRQQVADYSFRGRETQPLGKLTVSLGVASFPEDGIDGYSLVQSVDQALYQAKHIGRNIVC